MKTFRGWHVELHADGTMVFTSPTGRTTVTQPAGAAIYPTLARPTAPITPPPSAPRAFTDKGRKMPRRNQSRARQRITTIRAERRANVEARTNPRLHQYDEDYTYEETFLENRSTIPPPF